MKISDNRPNALANPVKVIAVSAGKGGVGKSNISINLSLALAALQKKILLLDADLGLANIDIMLGLTTQYNLSHVINGKIALAEAIVDGPGGIKIIPAASGTDYMTQLNACQHAGIINAFNELTEVFDYMIIDTAAGISDTVLSFASSAQELIVVVCDEPTSITDSYALIKVMRKRYGWDNFHIVTNMVKSNALGRELFQRIYRVAEQFLDVKLHHLGSIPFDNCIHQAVKKQRAVLLEYPDSLATKSFEHMAKVLEKWPFTFELGGNTSFFLEKFVAEGQKNNAN